MALHMAGENDSAFQHGQQAILLDPELADAWINLGNLYETGNKLEKAAEHYDRALALDDSGQLHLLGMACDGVDQVTGLSSSSGVAVSPDGMHVYGSGFFEGTLITLRNLQGRFSDGFESISGR